jgi:hypothetical protein
VRAKRLKPLAQWFILTAWTGHEDGSPAQGARIKPAWTRLGRDLTDDNQNGRAQPTPDKFVADGAERARNNELVG